MDLTHRHITKIARAATRYASSTLKKQGIGTTEFECLHIVRKNEGINQEAISEKLLVDKAAVTRMLQNLEKKGFITRKQDENDKRKNNVFSTPKALDIKFEETDAEKQFYEWLVEDLTEQELNALLPLLQTLYQKSKNERVCNYENINAWILKYSQTERKANERDKSK